MVIGIGGLSQGLQVLAGLLSVSSAFVAVSALSAAFDFVLQMPLYLRVPLLVGAFVFGLTLLWLFFFFGLAFLSRRLGRETADDRTASVQTSHAGPNISTGDMQGDPTININMYRSGGSEAEHQSPPVLNNAPESDEEENEPPIGPPSQSPGNPPEAPSALYPLLRDDELSKPEIKNRTVYIADFAWKAKTLGWTNAVIAERRFENCRIYGPAVLAPLKAEQDNRYTFVDCRWTEGVDAFWIAHPPGHPGFVGVIGLEDCFFEKCTFTQVGVLVPPADYERYRRDATNP